MIHAVPQRLWYVENFMLPELERQGADDVELWIDRDGAGNLKSCLDAFAAMNGEGGTWHIQDDLLFAKDFVKRAEPYRGCFANGFCCIPFHDNPWCTGQVYMPDAWHSFQCVYIRNDLAREFVEWVASGQWKESPNNELPVLVRVGKGDDTLFREFMLCRHADLMAYNFNPNLVEHIDWLIGGSTLKTQGKWYKDLPRSALWADEEMVSGLKARLRAWQAEQSQTTP